MKKLLLVLIISFFSQLSLAQLTDFSLTVTKTDETCTGNGSLSFTTTNTTSGATMIFSVYLQPDLTNPVAVLSEINLTGLSSGLYRIIATQSLGNLSNSQQVDIEILDLRVPLVFSLTSQPATCFTPGSITVSVTDGTPVTFEIIAGPITVPPQSSAFFPNLVAGTYDVRVNDACGDGVVQTHTIQQTEEPDLIAVVGQDNTQKCVLIDCDSTGINLEITPQPGSVIHYPLQIQITVYPPNGGTPVVINQTVASGDPALMLFDFSIPFYNVQQYNYDVVITGPCGVETEVLGSEIAVPANFSFLGGISADCSNFLTIDSICNMLPPFQVNFTSAPAGFNPADFNPNASGTFTTFPIEYFSSSQNLPIGIYTAQITDVCGNTVEQTFELGLAETEYILVEIPCTGNYQIIIEDIITVIIVQAPDSSGIQVPFNATGDIVNNNYSLLLVPGNYLFQGIGICGNNYSIPVIIPEYGLEIEVDTNNLAGCSTNYGSIKLTSDSEFVSVIITAAPTSFAFALPYNASGTINNSGCLIQNLPPGEYTLVVTDECGNVETVTAVVPVIISQGPLVFLQARGCGPDYDSIVFISPNGAITEFVITAAPASFPFPLPYDVSFNIASNGFFCMNSLPVGNYSFYSKDECNVERNVTMPLTGFAGTDNSVITPNCGSFDIDLQFINNASPIQTFWLQKYDAATNQWVHPITGVVYTPGSNPTGVNSYSLTNLAVNYNIAATGTFRVLIVYRIYQNGFYLTQNCIDVIKTFDFTGALNIDSGYSISCNSGSLEVAIIASGVAPFIYTITSKDGVPFFVNNGSSNLFTGLEPAIYNFQILDSCGNILNKLIDLNTLPEPQIVPTNLCEGQVGQLSVPAISYLNYQWWKGTDTSTILSTTNSLTFNPFSTVTSPGTYYVRIYSTSTLSCIDKIISFVVNDVDTPNAGQDGVLNLCGTASPINLFTVLGGTFDNSGTWQEVTSSGTLNGNTWSSNGVNFGQYVFNYTVNGLCGTEDESTVIINYNASPTVPVINGNQVYCADETLQLQVDDQPNAVFEWTGPNNFTSSNSVVTIDDLSEANEGEYTVKVTLNGCEATSTINIQIHPNPDFTFESLCDGSEYVVRVVPIENSFDPTTANYAWSGPNAFSSNSSQIVITNQQTGTYSVTITNSDNCSQTRTIDVASTLCDFPNIITPNNDGSNDSFDLTGFDIDKFEVYSRWGRLVYEEYNYSNGWRGQNMHNEFLPASTYYYILTLANGEEKHGWVLVAR
jgi:gliding motility-associated-like protein